MPEIIDLQRILGSPSWGERDRSMEKVEQELGLILSPDVREVLALYGDLLISDFLFLYGPEFAVEKGLRMSNLVRGGHPDIPRPVLPDEGGMFFFGHTVEGDNLFLEERAGQWRVSAFRRGWADWWESELLLVDWLVGVFEGREAADWMPEWPERHWFE